MTPEERKQAFVNEYNELVKKYGVVIVAKPNNEQMSGGEIVIKLPTVDLAFVDGWQPEVPKEPSQTSEPQDVSAPVTASSNGHKEKV